MKDVTIARYLLKSMEDNGFRLPKKYVREALEFEIEQMRNAWLDGYQKAKDDIICDTFSTFENYYQKNYE